MKRKEVRITAIVREETDCHPRHVEILREETRYTYQSYTLGAAIEDIGKNYPEGTEVELIIRAKPPTKETQ